MLRIVALLCLAGPALCWWPVPEFRPECGCCWPVPEECCEKPPTPPPVTEPPVTPEPPTEGPSIPPPTASSPECPCEANIIFSIDRTGSVEPPELNAVLSFAEDYASGLDPDCFKVAFVVFNNSGTVLSQLGDPIPSAGLAAQAAQAPGGQTDTARAFTTAKQIFDELPDEDDNCRVLALFYDGGTDFRPQLETQVPSLNQRFSARVCLMAMFDPEATDTQEANRLEEYDFIIDNSWASSEIADNQDWSQSPDLEDAATALDSCICKDCSGQPAPQPPP